MKNTDKAREKFVEDLEETHGLFKDFVKDNRDVVDIDEIATGEVWLGTKALEKKLVDELKTSDEYLLEACNSAEVYEISYQEKVSLQDKLGQAIQTGVDGVLLKWWERAQQRFYS